VYDPFFSVVQKNMKTLPQLEPGISQLIEEPGCSFASMTLRHITNDVTTFINKERWEDRKFQPPCTQDQNRRSFCAAAASAASNIGKQKKGRTPNSLERFSCNLECLATDERVSLRGLKSQTKRTKIHYGIKTLS
jgi:hypothetical protein